MGVLAVDGRIIIRARYMEVEIDKGWNGASYFGSGEDGNGEADGLIG